MSFAVNGTTGITFNDNTNMATAASLGPRNRIINGNMAIDQRNAGASQTITAGTFPYTVDRWFATSTGANVTGQRISGSNSNTYRYQFTGASGVSLIAFTQRIESYNIADLAGNTVTLSLDLANSILTTVNWQATYPSAQDNYTSSTTFATGSFTVSSTVTRYNVQISLPSNAANGLQIQLYVGAQTSGTWQIGNVQLEAGSVATPYQFNTYSDQLAQCQRYCYVMYGTFLATGAWSASTAAFYSGQFPVTMRTTPTLALSAAASSYSTYLVGPATYLSLTGLSLNGVTGAEWWLLTASFASGGQGQGQTTYLNSNGNTLQFSAEL